MQKTDFEYEILVHDDCSTDGTTEIVKEYENKYKNMIKPIYQDENLYSKGLHSFMEIFSKKAKGQYIALCDGDDYWTDPLKLQKQVDFLEANPEYVVCYHDAKIIGVDGNLIKKSILGDNYKKDYSKDESIKGAWMPTLTRCFRNVVKEYPQEFYMVPHGDLFITSILGHFGKAKYLEGIGACYRQQPNGAWSSLSEKKKNESTIVSYICLFSYYRRIGMDNYSQYFFEKMREKFRSDFVEMEVIYKQVMENKKLFSTYLKINRVFNKIIKFLKKQ